MDEKRSELRDRLFKMRSAAAASPTGYVAISIEMLNDADSAAKKLEQRVEALERDRDELWCRALTVLDSYQIKVVTSEFNRLRPDKALAADQDNAQHELA